MNRQTYPVHCGWCNTVVRTDGPVEGSTGICPACLAELRKEADAQFEHSVRCAGCGVVIQSNEPLGGGRLCFECLKARDAAKARPWWDEAAGERRALIDVPRQRGSDFLDGFLIGGAVAILLGILAEWLWHR